MSNRIIHSALTISFLFLLLSITSCGPYYGKGIQGAEYIALEHPWAEDEEKVTRNYASGSFGNPLTYVPGDKNQLGSLTFHRGGVKDGMVFGIGGTAFYGTYNVNSIQTWQSESAPIKLKTGRYGYGGLGFRGKIGFETTRWENFKWETIGLQMDLFHESGEYTKFRAIANESYNILTLAILKTDLRMTMTLNSNLRWRIGDKGIAKFGLGLNTIGIWGIRGIRTQLGIGFDRIRINGELYLQTTEYDNSIYSFVDRKVWQMTLSYAFGGVGNGRKKRR